MTDDLEFGLFAVDQDSRTVRGIIVPWGEASAVSQTGNAPLTFRPEDIRVPRDHSVVVLNRNHDRYDPIGRGARFDPSHPKGLFAEYRIAETEEGDAWLADHGSLVRLSPELRDIVRHPDGHATATLTGSALVEAGAFASAGLFAIGDVQDAPADVAASSTPERLELTADVAPTDIAVATPEGVTVYTPEDAPSEEPTEGEFAMTTSIVPDGAVTPEAETPNHDANGLFAALAQHGRTNDRSALQPYADVDADRTGLFALADITATGTAATVQSQFVGEIWGRKLYQQRVLPLFGHENLTALKVEGWRWVTPPVVGSWAGDKAEVPSAGVTFGQTAVTAERLAGAHDIDRALRDFGNESFWSGYFRAMTESYAKQADDKVLARIVAAPNAANGIGATVVTPGAVPTNVDPGVAALVDGALAVITAGYTPSFALVSTAIYRSMLLTPKDKVLEFLTSAMGLEEGSLAGFKIIPHAALAAKRVIVGAREAATVYELPGSPIRVEGLDVAKGGIDPGVYGYIATVVNDVTALASVTTL